MKYVFLCLGLILTLTFAAVGQSPVNQFEVVGKVLDESNGHGRISMSDTGSMCWAR